MFGAPWAGKPIFTRHLQKKHRNNGFSGPGGTDSKTTSGSIYFFKKAGRLTHHERFSHHNAELQNLSALWARGALVVRDEQGTGTEASRVNSGSRLSRRSAAWTSWLPSGSIQIIGGCRSQATRKFIS